jgi:poly(A) polymerase
LAQAIDVVFDARIGDISGRGRLAADMREVWMMQPRFDRRQANTAHALVEQPRFRAGYDFLRLRADAGEVPAELAEWWEDFSLGDADEREALLLAVRGSERSRRASSAVANPGADAVAEPVGEAAVAKKRRRRRRKPADGDGASASADDHPHAAADSQQPPRRRRAGPASET